MPPVFGMIDLMKNRSLLKPMLKFTKLKFILAVAILNASLLSGCSSLLSVNVTRFHEINTAEQKALFTNEQKRYQFVDEVENSNDLEKKQYAKQIAVELTRLGFTQSKQAAYKLDFKTSTPKSLMQTMQPSMNTGFYGGMGFGGRYGRSPYMGMGVNNYIPVTYEIFKNTLELELYDAKSGKRVWQSKSESDSSGGSNLVGLMPYLVKAALQGFPGESGRTIRVEFETTPKAGDNLPSSQLPAPTQSNETLQK
jgi:hypothetical protein